MHDSATQTLFSAGDRQGIGNVLASGRRAHRITQRQMEEISGMPQGRISRIERGAARPTLEELALLADVVGLDVSVSFTERRQL
ncbi:MAG: helix-turn-helix domain-containing protein [Microbacterium sp.]